MITLECNCWEAGAVFLGKSGEKGGRCWSKQNREFGHCHCHFCEIPTSLPAFLFVLSAWPGDIFLFPPIRERVMQVFDFFGGVGVGVWFGSWTQTKKIPETSKGSSVQFSSDQTKLDGFFPKWKSYNILICSAQNFPFNPNWTVSFWSLI